MRRHYVFEGRHAERIWQLAMTWRVASAVGSHSEALRAELKAHGGAVQERDWPKAEPGPLHLALSEAIVDYHGFARELPPNAARSRRPGLAGVEGAAPPDGFLLERTPDYVTWRYFRDGDFSFAIEYDAS
jgi:hypothetical protein